MRKGLGGFVLPLLLAMGTAHAQPGKVTYVYTDPQGTPLAEADANGNITATFDYKPYGQALGTPPTGPGYTGHVNDPDTGLVYMQARYYDPIAGRFLSIDPVVPSAGALFGFNRYDYANNNPANNIDPDGRDNCPGQSRSQCIRSDSGTARDLRSTPQQDSAAIANKSKVETSQSRRRFWPL
ncbi:RHS repeat-associated core domain-containing protein [Fulvimonas yonginensis]|uniref:RHS repeat-associated core domain-containing protein n=1 Tax=Fulvimonas yonginensis TaxID=1495200 RepID=A0ABU8JAR4_9GAMM